MRGGCSHSRVPPEKGSNPNTHKNDKWPQTTNISVFFFSSWGEVGGEVEKVQQTSNFFLKKGPFKKRFDRVLCQSGYTEWTYLDPKKCDHFLGGGGKFQGNHLSLKP